MAKLQKTEDDIRDEEMRANPMGLFNTACSYHVAARELDKLNLRTTHREMPVYLLLPLYRIVPEVAVADQIFGRDA